MKPITIILAALMMFVGGVAGADIRVITENVII